MSDFWVRAVGDDEYVTSVRYEKERKSLSEEIHKSTKTLIAQALGGENVEDITEKSSVLTQFSISLEMILKHGLKQRGPEKNPVTSGSATFFHYVENLERIPGANASGALNTLHKLDQVKTKEGKGRAWIRYALNLNLLEDQLSHLIPSQATINWFEPWAFLRDQGCSSFLLSLLVGLNGIPFVLLVDDSQLDYYLEIVKNNTPISQPRKKKTVRKKQSSSVISLDGDDHRREEKPSSLRTSSVEVVDNSAEEERKAKEIEENIRREESEKRIKLLEERIRLEREERKRIQEEEEHRRKEEEEKRRKEEERIENDRIQLLFQEQERKRKENLLQLKLKEEDEERKKKEKEEEEKRVLESKAETERALKELNQKFKELDGKYKTLEAKSLSFSSDQNNVQNNHVEEENVDKEEETKKEKSSLSLDLKFLKENPSEISNPSELPPDFTSSPSNSPRGIEVSAPSFSSSNALNVQSLPLNSSLNGYSSPPPSVSSPSLQSKSLNDLKSTEEEKIQVPTSVLNNSLNSSFSSSHSLNTSTSSPPSSPPAARKRGSVNSNVEETEEENLARRRKEAEERVKLRIAKMEEERKAKRASLPSSLKPGFLNSTEKTEKKMEIPKEIEVPKKEEPTLNSPGRKAVVYSSGAENSTDSGEDWKKSLDKLDRQLNSNSNFEDSGEEKPSNSQNDRLRNVVEEGRQERRPRKSSLPPTMTPGLDSPTREEYRKRLEDERMRKTKEEEKRKVEEAKQILMEEQEEKRKSFNLMDEEKRNEFLQILDFQRTSRDEEANKRREEETRQIQKEEDEIKENREEMRRRLEFQRSSKDEEESKRREEERLQILKEEEERRRNKSKENMSIEEQVAQRIARESLRTSKIHVEQFSSSNLFSTPDRSFNRDLQEYANRLESQTNKVQNGKEEIFQTSPRNSNGNSYENNRNRSDSNDKFLLKSGEVEPFSLRSTGGERVADLILEEEFSASPVARRPTENRYLLKYLEPKKGKKNTNYTLSTPTMSSSPLLKGEANLDDLEETVLDQKMLIVEDYTPQRQRAATFNSKSHSAPNSSSKGRPKSKIFDVRVSNDLLRSAPLELLAQQQSALENVVYYDIPVKGNPSDQNNLCHNCFARLETGLFAPKPRYCEYTGKYFCKKCHTNQKSIIPARILQHWDFRPYPVSDASLIHLETTLDDPIYDIASVNSSLFYKVPNLRNVKILRRQLFYLKDYILNCDRVSQEKVMKELSGRLHVIHNTDIYSLRDLIELNTDQLVEWIRELTERFIIHVTKCTSCKSRGMQCGICKDPKVIYLFNVRTVTECKRCHTPFHRSCRRKETSCPVCQRLDFVAGSPSLRKSAIFSPDLSPEGILLNPKMKK